MTGGGSGNDNLQQQPVITNRFGRGGRLPSTTKNTTTSTASSLLQIPLPGIEQLDLSGATLALDSSSRKLEIMEVALTPDNQSQETSTTASALPILTETDILQQNSLPPESPSITEAGSSSRTEVPPPDKIPQPVNENVRTRSSISNTEDLIKSSGYNLAADSDASTDSLPKQQKAKSKSIRSNREASEAISEFGFTDPTETATENFVMEPSNFLKKLSGFVPFVLNLGMSEMEQIPLKFKVWVKGDIVNKQEEPINCVYWIVTGSAGVTRVLPFLQQVVVTTTAGISGETKKQGEADTKLTAAEIKLRNTRTLKPWSAEGEKDPQWKRIDVSIDCQVLEEGDWFPYLRTQGCKHCDGVFGCRKCRLYEEAKNECDYTITINSEEAVMASLEIKTLVDLPFPVVLQTMLDNTSIFQFEATFLQNEHIEKLHYSNLKEQAKKKSSVTEEASLLI